MSKELLVIDSEYVHYGHQVLLLYNPNVKDDKMH